MRIEKLHRTRSSAMRGLVAQGMRDGAFGMSTGLFYVPGSYAPTEEIIELAKVVGQMGGIHTSHMREETSRVTERCARPSALEKRAGSQRRSPITRSSGRTTGEGASRLSSWSKRHEREAST